MLRQHGTERPGTSPLNAEKRPGVFACAGCSSEWVRTEGWTPRNLDGSIAAAVVEELSRR